MECHVGISLNLTKTRVRVMDTLQRLRVLRPVSEKHALDLGL